jgi:Zn finger protein HypA/HybF involved in hydrogenase expression
MFESFLKKFLTQLPAAHRYRRDRVSELNYLRIKTFELLIWLAHRVGVNIKLHPLQCPLCAAQSFMIDSYLYFHLDCFSDATPDVLKLDLEISDAVIICRNCREEIEIKDAAVELIKLIVSSGTNWLRL